MGRSIRISTVAASFALVACTAGDGLEDTRHATGSTTIVANSAYSALIAVNSDQGTITKMDAVAQTVLQELDVGSEPTRIARLDDRYLVTLRAQRAIAVVRDTEGGMTLERTIETGTEPFGIVASEDGQRVYVALSTNDRIDELDGPSLDHLRSWDVGGEPKWLALHPSGESLYVGSVFGGFVTWIDLTEDGVSQSVGLPMVEEVTPLSNPDFVTLTPRVTGDMSVSVRGDMLYVPALYVDNTSDLANAPSDCYYGCTGNMSLFNPAIVEVPVDPDGEPHFDRAVPVDIAMAEGTPFEVEETESFFGINFAGSGRSNSIRGYPASVTPSPDGRHLLVTYEASDAVAVISRVSNEEFSATDTLFGTRGTLEMEKDIQVRPRGVILGGAGPQGAAFLADGDAWVHDFLDDRLERVGVPDLTERTDVVFERPQNRDKVFISTPVLPSQVLFGRRLFMTNTDDRMAAAGSGVSCWTCHFDGRTDGLSWSFTLSHARQTPSLAGLVSQTEPVTWNDNVSTVQHEAMETAGTRMGGRGLGSQHADAIAAFIDYVRPVDHPHKGSSDPLVIEGKAIFERADVGCAECHNGPRFTDNKAYDMFGIFGVHTRGLEGISQTAPYLHDGSAHSLREVLERSRSAVMGDTSMLTEREMDALEAYLKSL